MLSPTLRSTILLILAVCWLAGCEEDANPVIGTDQAFTIYGYFNPGADTQAARVFQIDDELLRTRPEPIDARVRSINLTTGDEVVWADSIVEFSFQQFGHVFYAPFRAEFEHRYRIEVMRSDGVVTSAEAIVPPASMPELLAPKAQRTQVRLPVLWRGAERLINIAVIYHLNFDTIRIEYPLEAQQATADGLLVEVKLLEDARRIFREAAQNFSGPVLLNEIEMRVFVVNEDWQLPAGVSSFDPELLVEPGTFSNVENGFGYFGSGYPSSIQWLPDSTVLVQAGFNVE